MPRSVVRATVQDAVGYVPIAGHAVHVAPSSPYVTAIYVVSRGTLQNVSSPGARYASSGARIEFDDSRAYSASSTLRARADEMQFALVGFKYPPPHQSDLRYVCYRTRSPYRHRMSR